MRRFEFLRSVLVTFAVGSLLLVSGCGRQSSIVSALDPVDQASSEESPGPVALSASELHTLRSKHVGGVLQIMVAVPYSYDATEQDYPVVYALDANGMFATIVETARMASIGQEMPEVIVVGIGYEVESPMEVMALRTRDYTPTRTELADSSIADQLPDLAGTVHSGGAGPFLDFIRGELIPWVDARYRTTEGADTLVGDSYGGLFGLYTLFHHPDTFSRYLIGSPSIWYGDEVSFSYEERYAEDHDDLAAKVFLSAGALEEIAGNAESEGFAMVSNTFEMEERLQERGYPGLELSSQLFDGETHLSVIPAAMSRGMRVLLEDLKPTSGEI